MRRLTAWMLVLALGAATSGCAGVSRPSWLFPGTAEVQQQRARRYDPYPEPQVGPDIVGGRPLSYENPRAEVRRVQPPLDPYSSPR
jgi:hypothetical protein